MEIETADEASTEGREGARRMKRDRCVQRTVELTGPEIAAIEATEMAPNPEDPDLSVAKQADD